VRQHEIDCDWERRPAYAYTEDEFYVGQIEQEVEAAQQAGLPASLSEQTDLPWPVKAAVRFDDQVQLRGVRKAGARTTPYSSLQGFSRPRKGDCAAGAVERGAW